MDQSLENKFSLKIKITNFYNLNKNKIYIFLSILILALISFTYSKLDNERKNIKVAENYIKAGIYLSSDNKDNAKDIYEEIILSKNNFYSILALNTMIEKNLISDKKKILDYFLIIENSTLTNEAEDIITLKKALYLIKETENQKGKNLLKGLIDKNSHLKSIAEELLKK
tara:strand:- start:1510 stop:2019 length:510 start_codon:yes stop_codon:yes gene_type:complete